MSTLSVSWVVAKLKALIGPATFVAHCIASKLMAVTFGPCVPDLIASAAR